MDLVEACGTGVNVIGIMIHEGYPEGSASCQTNVSAGVHGSLLLGHRWGFSQTRVGDNNNKNKKGTNLKQRSSPTLIPNKNTNHPHASFAAPNTARGAFFPCYVCVFTLN